MLPEFRGRGYGTEYAHWILSRAMALDTDRIETVVLTANEPGLRFAQRMGFEKFARYTVGDSDAEYADLWLTAAPDPAR